MPSSFMSCQDTPNQTDYYLIYDWNNNIYNTVTGAMEAPNPANLAQYPYPATEQVIGGIHTGYYSAPFPISLIAAGKYNFVLYQQVNGNPAPNLAVDSAVDRGFIIWDGYTEAFSVAAGPSNSNASAWSVVVEPVS